MAFIANLVTGMSFNLRTVQAVLNSQLKVVDKNPQLKPDIVTAHAKLID